MQAPVGQTVTRWTRASNRRRATEEALRLLGWSGLVVGAGLAVWIAMRAGLIPAAPPWTIGVAGIPVIGLVVRAIVRYRRRRLTADALAAKLDHDHDTCDVLRTAMAIEGGDTEAPEDFAATIAEHATRTARGIQRPFAKLRLPGRALAGGTLATAAALVFWPGLVPIWGLLPETLAHAATTPPGAEDTDPETVPTDDEDGQGLSDDTKKRLRDDATALAHASEKAGLSDSTRDLLRKASKHLDEAGRTEEDPLSELSRAQQALSKADAQSDQERFDREELGQMDSEEVSKALSEALAKGAANTAAELAEELARRVDPRKDPAGAQRLGEELERALSRQSDPQDGGRSKTGPDGEDGLERLARERERDPADPRSRSGDPDRRPGDPASSRRPSDGSREGLRPGDPSPSDGQSRPGGQRQGTGQRQSDAARDAARDLRQGKGRSGRKGLRKLAEQLRRDAPNTDGSLDRAVARALADARRAKAEQLGRGTKPGKGPPSSGRPGDQGKAGKAGGPQQSGSLPLAGEAREGPPSGRPAPGGGDGTDRPRGDGLLPRSTVAPADRVDATPDGPAQGVIKTLRRVAHQGRRDDAYREIHQTYSAIAESAVRREQIPLVRRDYIRSYFEAVRPQ